MKTLVLSILLLCAIPVQAATYYGAASGCNDANPGTSGSRWCTPNHALNAGDIIMWSVGSYTNTSSFYAGQWGAVTGTGHYVAWNICETPFGCTVTGSNGGPTVFLSASHWAMSGFVFTQSVASDNYGCVQSTGTVHDIIMANNIATGCYGGGFAIASSDYLVYIANIVYNGAQESSQCASGFPVNVPVAADTLPGTHIYLAQNFSWGNVNPNPCAGGAPSDGEGFIFDSWDGNTYTGQGVLENNVALFNGSNGFQVWNTNGSNSFRVYIRNNTSWANNTSTSRSSALCGEFTYSLSSGLIQHIETYKNIGRTNAATACGSNPNYAFLEIGANATDVVYQNWGYSAAGNNQSCQFCSGFVLGTTNTLGTDPAFTNAPATIPAAPNCTGFATVPACMASLISDLTPTAAGSTVNGYQPVKLVSEFNPLYPQWLCQYSTQLAGLVTQGCTASGTLLNNPL